MSLCHQPAAGRVTVVVLKARNLPKMDITGMSGMPMSDVMDECQACHFRPVCQDIPAAQGPAHLKEENACQEKNPQSGV